MTTEIVLHMGLDDDQADEILSAGAVDWNPAYEPDVGLAGVDLLDRSPEEMYWPDEGAPRVLAFRFDTTREALAQFKRHASTGDFDYWLIPAAYVKAHATIEDVTPPNLR